MYKSSIIWECRVVAFKTKGHECLVNTYTKPTGVSCRDLKL